MKPFYLFPFLAAAFIYNNNPAEGGVMSKTYSEVCDVVNSNPNSIKAGSIKFWGEFFGKPFDGYHRLVGCRCGEGFVEFSFIDGEVLTIYNPEGISVNVDEFIIEYADRINWSWYSYDMPHIEENRNYFEYKVLAGRVEVRTSVRWSVPVRYLNRVGRAVEVV